MQRTSDIGIALIKRFEGLRLEAYRDVAGVWTIGYGHTGRTARAGARITEPEAEALLARDLGRFEKALRRLAGSPLPQPQFDALVSLSYNIGIGAFARSTALARFRSGDERGAAEAIGWCNKATIGGEKRVLPGLVRRRAAEAALFLEGAAPLEPPCPAPACPQRPLGPLRLQDVVATQLSSSCTSRSKVRKS